MLLGPELLGWVQPSSLGSALFVLVDSAVAVVLFEGGLNLEGSRLRRQERTIRYLITVGAVVTMILDSAAAWWYLNWPWLLAFLFGSLVVVTGPTVVTPLLRDLRLRPRLRTILEAEGVLIRPLGVWLSTVGSGLPMRERLFIAWISPRGIVAAALASLAAVAMTRSGVTGGAELRALVFLTIAVTVFLAGLTAWPVAALLGARLPNRDRVAILGAHGLGLALGEVLRQADTPAVLLDSDPKRCHEAEEAGFTVVFGDALEERTMLRAQFESVGTAIGLTPNVHLNSLFTNQARQFFGVPLTYILVDALPGGKRPDHVKRHEAKVLFEGPHDAERGDVRWRHREVVIEPFTRSAESATARNEDDDQNTISNVQAKEQSVILAIRRDKRLVPMTLHLAPRPGDVAWIAIHVPQHEEAVAKLQETGWNSSAEEIEL